ncbi:MAG: SIS domain-containing protein [Caldisericia bacterium]|jgi:glucose/mannose-6-phosphate isomerase|nr:SIS domain-containing protein [Caldisericia bacterium]
MSNYEYILEEIKRVPEDIEEILISFKDYDFKEIMFNNILFLGTGGGSRASFDVLLTYLFDKSPYPIFIHQGYEIPSFVNEKTLVFSVSYSGETEETISSTLEALKKTKNIFILTKGGFLEKLAKEKRLFFIKLKDGYEARHALHLIFFSILKILSHYLHLNLDDEIIDTIRTLKEIKKKSHEDIRKIVDEIKGKIPFIYGSYLFSDSLSERLRRQLNENGKTLSHSNIVPSLHHDEIVGFMDNSLSQKVFVILIRDLYEDEKINKRFEITKKVLESYGFKYYEIYPENSLYKLSRMFSIIYKIDLISLEFAKIRDFDPKDVKIIEYLKELMKK